MFNSREVREWARRADIKLKLSSAFHSESNGRSERNVGVIKQLLAKASSQKECMEEALSLFNATPWSALGVSPSRMVLGRDPRVPGLLGVRDDKNPLQSGQAQWLNKNKEKRGGMRAWCSIGHHSTWSQVSVSCCSVLALKDTIFQEKLCK